MTKYIFSAILVLTMFCGQALAECKCNPKCDCKPNCVCQVAKHEFKKVERRWIGGGMSRSKSPDGKSFTLYIFRGIPIYRKSITFGDKPAPVEPAPIAPVTPEKK